jgi:hypothetical protein
MILNMLYDFIRVLKLKRKHPTKDYYFPMHILFFTVCLLQDYIFNPRNYYEQKINMINFVQATDHDVHMYAKMQCTNVHKVL